VTESKKAKEAINRARSELAHMARVTTLSALTASIAHEINQPIAAVTASAGACLRWLNRDQPEVQRAREAAMRIEEDGRRASEIIPLEVLLQERRLAATRDGLGQRHRARDVGVAAQRGRPSLGGGAYRADGGSPFGDRRPGAVATGVDESNAERDGGDERARRRAQDQHTTRGWRRDCVGE